MLAGGGIKRGLVYGASDPTAAEPDLDPVSPEDLATTMYHLLGIVADKELMAPGDRPVEIVDGGRVVKVEADSLMLAFPDGDFAAEAISRYRGRKVEAIEEVSASGG